MSLEFRSGRFWIVYRPDGRYGKLVRYPIPAAIRDEALARRFHDEFTADWKKAKSGVPDQPGPLTGLRIRELWKEYLKWSELHHAASTHKDLLGIGQHVERHLGQYDAEAINQHHFAIYQKMRAAEASRPIPRAINKETAYLGGFVKWAGRHGHITARKIQVDRLKYNRPIPIILSVEEVLRILESAEPFYRAFFMCLYSLGLRIGEVRGLRWGNVDKETMTITVRQKGGTYKRLPMGEALKEALSGLGAGGPEELVFESRRRGSKGGPVRDVRQAIARACKKAKVEKRVTPHLFRHSISCHLMGRNVNASVIQGLLGHAQLATTQWYSHVSMANLRDVGNVISGLISGNGTRQKPEKPKMVRRKKRKALTGAASRAAPTDS